MTDELRNIDANPLTADETLCLAIRETAIHHWSDQHNPTHRRACRFCAGILHSARELRDANMELDDNGQPIPRTT